MKALGLELPVDKTAKMTIYHPIKRKPLIEAGADPETAEPAWIELYSLDSQVARNHEHDAQQRLIDVRRQLQSRGSFTPEELEENAVELLAALTKDWRLLSLDVKPPAYDFPCTLENRKEFYRQPGVRWLREQIDAFLTNRANFA
jgi:hypothetical protein